MSNNQEVLGLLDRSALENSPAIRRLLDEFQKMLPNHFGRPCIIPAPAGSNFKSVLRADCSNPDCSVRAFVHLLRGDNDVLRIQEEEPIFDRARRACSQCQKILI